MITVVSDTHGTDDHRLTDRTLRAVREADVVVHAGDFTTETVLEAFESEAEELVAVSGNRDESAVRERVPETATTDADGVRLVVTHGHRDDETSLSLLARQEDADLVVVGHSHRPGIDRREEFAVLNPGSHADPRRYQAAHAELEPIAEGVRVRLVTPDGEVFRTVSISEGST